MKLAWFRAHLVDPTASFDDSAALIAELRTVHRIDVFTAPDGDGFVQAHARERFDLCVYELNSATHAFIRPYFDRYGGVIVLRAMNLRDIHHFLTNSAVSATPHSAIVATLQEQYPAARIRYGPIAVAKRRVTAKPSVEDVVRALHWPYAGEPMTDAIVGMAEGKPVVVFEMDVTADWPMLDPQTWQTRGSAGVSPIAISIDPRDEQHSAAAALRRLSTDARLRETLGQSGYDWWHAHASPEVAGKIWSALLEEAASVTAPIRSQARS
jgi:hypothetical protein